jgi:hypothetical protein
MRKLTALVALVLASTMLSSPAGASPTTRSGEPVRFYCDALDALSFRKWTLAALLLNQSIRERPEEGGRKIPCTRFWEWYIPRFYLGKAFLELGLLPEAFLAWRASSEAQTLRRQDQRHMLRWIEEIYPERCASRRSAAAATFSALQDRASWVLDEARDLDLDTHLTDTIQKNLALWAVRLDEINDSRYCMLSSPPSDVDRLLAAGLEKGLEVAELEKSLNELSQDLSALHSHVRAHYDEVSRSMDQLEGNVKTRVHTHGITKASLENPTFLTPIESELEAFIKNLLSIRQGRCIPHAELENSAYRLARAGVEQQELTFDFVHGVFLAARNCLDAETAENLLNHRDRLGELGFWITERVESEQLSEETLREWAQGYKDLGVYDRTDSHAVLLGGTNYEHWEPKLVSVGDELVRLKADLESLGFQVAPIVYVEKKDDLTEERLSRFIRQYGEGKRGRVLVYWTGHGARARLCNDDLMDHWKKDYPGVIRDVELGFLVPSDAPALDSAKWDDGCPQDTATFDLLRNSAIDLDTFKGWFIKEASDRGQLETPPFHSMVILDGCHAGNVLDGIVGVPSSRIDGAEFARPQRVFIVSAVEGEAQEAGPKGGEFRLGLTRGIKGCADENRDGYVTGGELAFYLGTIEFEVTRQRPWFGSYPSRAGYFAFQREAPIRNAESLGDACPPPSGEERASWEAVTSEREWAYFRKYVLDEGLEEKALERLQRFPKDQPESPFRGLAARILSRLQNAPPKTIREQTPASASTRHAPLRFPESPVLSFPEGPVQPVSGSLAPRSAPERTVPEIHGPTTSRRPEAPG